MRRTTLLNASLLIALLMIFAALPALAFTDDDRGPVFEVDYSNPGLSPSHWVLTLYPDGSGHFHSERGDVPGTTEEEQSLNAPDVNRDIKVSADFAGRVFEEVRQHRLFASGCEGHLKVAFQGWKKFTYRGPDGQGSCTFNYSKDKDIQDLGERLVAVAGTIVEGARLEWQLRYDRLGLDHEMEFVLEAAGDGRLQQFVAIRGILERLAGDDGVMERVRKRARILLTKTEG